MTTRGWRWALSGACALALAVCAVPAEAQVKMRTRADGTIEIYNDGPGNALRSRAPLVLRAVPRADWNEWILDSAYANGVDPKLVQAIMQVESGYNCRALSRTGAMGLMQLMPDTARLMQVADAFSPEQNIRGGVSYLRQMIDRFERLEYAIAAYNAGPGAVTRHGGVPPYAETRDYVDRVLTLYRGTPGAFFNGLISVVASGAVAARPNGLAQSSQTTMLQRALASGSFAPAAAPQPQPAAAVVARRAPAAAPVPVAAPAVVPAVVTTVAAPLPAVSSGG